ncbi:hypothetical protein Psal006b_00856 [Piscirickettsia salmonis]|uniref:Cytidine deaminase n=1 Tax=Piscirickettsia salmonis TaxID=1238 RepID=A0A1L6TDS4_PISSA|nr:hypothetical protein [Piscirickettsia salmonis]ALB23522.1 cytidine deaminase [Piscirickettsia salmonis]ALT18608.1 hypothetical protein PSLF89_07120 [Piscirickettsia salmonis LF-89 = ATCC VR-1361]ALY03395.1 hypothetical protein AWE47_11510 [Piscirickettsia salmonis]AMA42959.1 hypothetical protein AWJ11_11735 [Piscirickettsia salmonis]AOS35429.1 hypothetical protein AVM72_08865 [Piscirickettsia salmonis]
MELNKLIVQLEEKMKTMRVNDVQPYDATKLMRIANLFISAVVVKHANEINAREWIQKFSVEFEASLTQSVDRCFKCEYYHVNMVN